MPRLTTTIHTRIGRDLIEEGIMTTIHGSEKRDHFHQLEET